MGRELTDLLAGHEVIDLTLPLAEHLPGTWPGPMPFRATVWTWFADRPGDPQPVRPQTGGGYQTRWLVMDEHTGTHIDAPRHFSPPVTVAELTAWEDAHGAIRSGDMVLLRTGWDRRPRAAHGSCPSR
jgi:kynurenine formamidase